MRELATILVVYLSGEAIHIPYDTREACSDAMVQFAESDLGQEPDAWSQCRAHYAPATSMRPIARPVR